MKYSIKLFLIAVILLAGCTIQKRHYMPGYSIQWKKSYKKNVEDNLSEVKEDQGLTQTELQSRTDIPQKEIEQSGRSSASNSRPHASVTKTAYLSKEDHGELDGINDTKTERRSESIRVSEKNDEHQNITRYSNRAPENKNGNSLLLWSSLAIGVSSYTFFRMGKRNMRNYTKWAKYNPKKAQLLIAGLQLPLLGIGVYGGYNLHQMGYTVSQELMYGFGAITALGFATVPFLPKRDTFTLPRTINRRRITFLSMTVAGLMMSTIVGNRLDIDHPNGTLTTVVKGIDQSLVSGDNYHQGNSIHTTDYSSSELQKLHKKQQLKKRLLLAGGSCALGVFLIILLLAPLCAGICMVVFGVSGGTEGALLIVGGIALTVLSIIGMVAAAKMCSKE